MTNRYESIAGRRAIAPVRHPGGLEPQPRLSVQNIESTWQPSGMRAHVGHALVVRRSARAGDAPARATEVPGDDGEIDAGRRNLSGVSIVVVTRSRQLVMGDRLVDQRCRVLRLSHLTHATGGIEDGGVANELTRDTSDPGDVIEVVFAEARSPGGESGVA